MIRISLVVFAVSVFLAYLAADEWKLSKGASSEPESTTLEALIDRGVDGNPHLLISDFVSCKNMVVESKGGKWTKVWVPVVPLKSFFLDPEPQNIAVLVITKEAKNEDELSKILGEDAMQGMIINKIESLGFQEWQILHNNYTETSFENCIIFEPGREPASTWKVMLYGGLALLTLIVAVALFLSKFRSRTS